MSTSTLNNDFATSSNSLWHDAFYHFVRLDDPYAIIEALKDISQGLQGSILVAHEGINGMLAGSEDQLNIFHKDLARDSRFAGKFSGIDYKRSECKTSPFHRLKIKYKPEIVPLDIAGVDATVKTGINISPEDWQELIKQEDVVVIDNRNDFEYRLGRFKGAINPEVNNFRDFPEFMKENLPKWQREGKRIAMYCTGGIRCEKTSSWLLDLNTEVYQLAGGILNYFEKMPCPEEDWEGECFVFDNRVALDASLKETPTTIEDVYDPLKDDKWRFERAQYLQHGPSQEPHE